MIQQTTDDLPGGVYLKGGIISCMETAHLAEAFRINYELHRDSNSLNNIANLHMIMDMPITQLLNIFTQ